METNTTGYIPWMGYECGLYPGGQGGPLLVSGGGEEGREEVVQRQVDGERRLREGRREGREGGREGGQRERRRRGREGGREGGEEREGGREEKRGREGGRDGGIKTNAGLACVYSSPSSLQVQLA